MPRAAWDPGLCRAAQWWSISAVRRIRRITGMALAGLALGALPALAGQLRDNAGNTTTAAAGPAADRDEVELTFEKYTLDNGLEVILHRDLRAPTVAVSVWYHVGSGDETPDSTGFAHLFEHMMFQGAKHIGEDVHFDILREIGVSSVNGSTNKDRTNYYEVVPSQHLETALWLESDRMGYMLDILTEESLANQRDVVRNERRQNYDDRPYGRSRFAVAAALYPEGHPYRYLTIGRHEDLEKASLGDVQDFFLKWYVPSNATLTIAGDIDVEKTKALVDKWFGSFPKLPKPEHREVERPEIAPNTSSSISDPFAAFERVQLVWHGPSYFEDDDLALDVVSTVLSADGWGRLNKRLVLEEKLATSVWASNQSAQRSGVFDVSITLRPGVEGAHEKAVAIAEEEIQKLLAQGITTEELARVRRRVESSFIFGLESVLGRAEGFQRFNHYKGDPGWYRTYLEKMETMTPDSVLAGAKRWLSAPHAEVTTVPGKGGSSPEASSSDAAKAKSETKAEPEGKAEPEAKPAKGAGKSGAKAATPKPGKAKEAPAGDDAASKEGEG